MWQQGKSGTELSATLQVAQLHEHYRTIAQRDTSPRFLGINGAQLPSPLWDTEKWVMWSRFVLASLSFGHTGRTQQGASRCWSNSPSDMAKPHTRLGQKQDWCRPWWVEPIQLPGGWQLFQMEYLPRVLEEEVSGWVTLSYLLSPSKATKHLEKLLPPPGDRQLLINRAQQLLKAAHSTLVSGRKAAHGDARPDNILVLMRLGHIVELKLINLDWAGLAGEERYPTLLNTVAIQWPDGVAAGQPLEQEHDLELLNLQTHPVRAAATVNWRRLTTQPIAVSEAMEVE